MQHYPDVQAGRSTKPYTVTACRAAREHQGHHPIKGQLAIFGDQYRRQSFSVTSIKTCNGGTHISNTFTSMNATTTMLPKSVASSQTRDMVTMALSHTGFRYSKWLRSTIFAGTCGISRSLNDWLRSLCWDVMQITLLP